MSRLRVFIGGPLTGGGLMEIRAIHAYRHVQHHAAIDLGRAGFSCYNEPAIYDHTRKMDETYQARAFEESKPWIQTSDIFLRLAGKCIEADQREYFARLKNVIVVSSVKELIEKMENG